jgi:hypothetical protein
VTNTLVCSSYKTRVGIDRPRASLSNIDKECFTSNGRNLIATRCPLAVYSLSTRCPLAVHSLSTRCPLAVHSLSTRCPLAVHSLSTRCPLAVHSLLFTDIDSSFLFMVYIHIYIHIYTYPQTWAYIPNPIPQNKDLS